MAGEKKYNEGTICGRPMQNIDMHGNRVYLRSRYDKDGNRTQGIHEMTWGEFDKNVREYCSGMIKLGFKEFDRVGVFGHNQPRWVVSGLANVFMRGTTVTMYPNNKEEDVWWNLYDSGARFVICGGKEQFDKAYKVKEKAETLEKIIVMTPIELPKDPSVMSFNDLLKLGRENMISNEEFDKRVNSVKEEDLAVIIYTSGTTGRPKGVMLTHRNIVSQLVIASEFGFALDDVWLSHLPMSHSFGFSADLMNAGSQAGIMFVSDSLESEEMKKALLDCRPTVMSSVPRLWEKFYITINNIINTSPPFRQKLIKWALANGREAFILRNDHKPLPPVLGLKMKVADALFMKVKEKAGLDRMRMCFSGGGPIDKELIMFYGSMGINIYQGFGLTETAPIINANTPKHNKVGTVGRPIPGVVEKIDADGEVLVKGPMVMKGYYNNPEATREAFSEDGFFRTGDIGEIDSDGYLKITDRKKELLITSAGKNIAPQPIENAFNTNQFIEQVTLIGDNRNYCTALIVPEFENLRKWAKDKGLSFANDTEMVKSEQVLKFMDQQVAEVNNKLARYEQIKKFVLLDKSFSIETGELTPSLKKKRRVIAEKYKEQIESMYQN